jgi:hypothetical protein
MIRRARSKPANYLCAGAVMAIPRRIQRLAPCGVVTSIGEGASVDPTALWNRRANDERIVPDDHSYEFPAVSERPPIDVRVYEVENVGLPDHGVGRA